MKRLRFGEQRSLLEPSARYLASQRAAVDYCNEVVDGGGRLQYLDSVVSVSGLELERDLYADISDQ